MSEESGDVDHFLALVSAAQEYDPRLTTLQAAVVVAVDLGLASDSRSFAKVFGVAHALALREINDLIELGDTIALVKREPRTLRTFYRLVDQAPVPA